MNRYVTDAEADALLSWANYSEFAEENIAQSIKRAIATRKALLDGVQDCLDLLRAVVDQNAIPKDERTAELRRGIYDGIGQLRTLAAEIRGTK